MSQEQLLERIRLLEEENSRLKKEKEIESLITNIETSPEYPLSLEEYRRYGRQMIVPEFGYSSQLKVKQARVLVVGAGGLGCPALLYLSAAGVGKLGIIDDDTVDVSNLHRQVMHTTDRVGEFKCESARKYINRLNPFVEVETYPFRLDNQNAFDIFAQYDVVLDCTDTPLTRYLVSDVAVLSGIPIVSASGLKTEGQLSILNFNNTGPCYRCFYPKPPPPNSVTSCQDGGIIGPVIGIMGTMMALETLKLISGTYKVDDFKPFLSIYGSYPQQSLRTFKMRGRKPDCSVCSEQAIITKEAIMSGEVNYVTFCGSKMDNNVLDLKERISVVDYKTDVLDKHVKHTLLDVRVKEQFDIVKLPKTDINVPWEKLVKMGSNSQELKEKLVEPVYVVCRYGNDSQLATRFLKEKLQLDDVRDIMGGLNKWSEKVDPKFPKY